MKHSIVLLSLVLAGLPLTACVEDGYDDGLGGYYAYDGYYDGYYGPIYDGYWGSNGYFYYRRSEQDRHYRQGDHDHFRRGGDIPQGRPFNPMQGNTRPPHGARMPHFDSGRRGGSHQGERPDRNHP